MDDPPFEKSNKKSSFSVYHYDAQLALAFQSDCECLLKRFEQGQNFTFKAFSQAWRNMCFLGIYEGQKHILALQTFIENCFFIVKKFLYSTDLYIQTGALYIMYGLYYKQPVKDWVKIRLTEADYEKITEIIETHKSSDLQDPNFIFSKMRIDGVFQYCALPQIHGLEVKFMRRINLSNEEINLKTSRVGVMEKFKNLMEADPALVEFEETDNEYQQLSLKYKEKHGNLFVFPSNLGEELKKTYRETFEIDLDDKTEQDSPTKRIKNKAMSSKNAVYRGDKKVFSALDLYAPSTSK